jgi:hypothetical protein
MVLQHSTSRPSVSSKFHAAGTRPVPLVDRINDRYGRCAIGFGLFPPDVRAYGHAAFHRVPESWEF